MSAPSSVRPTYVAAGHLILNRDDYPVARVPDSALALEACELMNRADAQHQRRHYTAAARLYAQAEATPGFTWSWS